MLRHIARCCVLRIPPLPCQALCAEWLHCSHVTRMRYPLDARDADHQERDKEIQKMKGEVFDAHQKKERNRQTYQTAIEKYNKRGDKYARGHVEFIYAAMERMVEFGVQKDLKMYKMLVDVFPKEKMVTHSVWQTEFMHYPKQQQCAIDLMSKMSHHGVCPDDEMGHQLIAVFGMDTKAFRKYQRMMYWLPKFKYINPWHIPHELPTCPIELAKMVLRRACPDLENEVTVFQEDRLTMPESGDFEGVVGKTWVVSAQSPTQRRLLSEHPTEKAVFVDGGYRIWLRDVAQTYYVLRSAVTTLAAEFDTRCERQDNDPNEWFNLAGHIPYEESEPPSDLLVPPSVHEQPDYTVLALCIPGVGDKMTLSTWITHLQRTNPSLARTPVIFTLRSPDEWLEELELEAGEVKDTSVAVS